MQNATTIESKVREISDKAFTEFLCRLIKAKRYFDVYNLTGMGPGEALAWYQENM